METHPTALQPTISAPRCLRNTMAALLPAGAFFIVRFSPLRVEMPVGLIIWLGSLGMFAASVCMTIGRLYLRLHSPERGVRKRDIFSAAIIGVVYGLVVIKFLRPHRMH